MRILLGSPTQSVIERWQSILNGERQFDLELANTFDEVFKAAAQKKFDLILLHRFLVDLQGCSEIRRQLPDCKIYILSDHPSEDEGLEFLKLGVVGYGNTYISQKRLQEALHVISTGGVWLGQKVVHKLILEAYNNIERQKGSVSITTADTRLSRLTPMERKVAVLVASGMTNLEIAAELGITERTVKAHLTATYEKLRIANRLSLALFINQL